MSSWILVKWRKVLGDPVASMLSWTSRYLLQVPIATGIESGSLPKTLSAIRSIPLTQIPISKTPLRSISIYMGGHSIQQSKGLSHHATPSRWLLTWKEPRLRAFMSARQLASNVPRNSSAKPSKFLSSASRLSRLCKRAASRQWVAQSRCGINNLTSHGLWIFAGGHVVCLRIFYLRTFIIHHMRALPSFYVRTSS